MVAALENKAVAKTEDFSDQQFELVAEEARSFKVSLATIFRDGIRDYERSKMEVDRLEACWTMIHTEFVSEVREAKDNGSMNIEKVMRQMQKAAEITKSVAELRRTVSIEVPERYLRMLAGRKEATAPGKTVIHADTVNIAPPPEAATDDWQRYADKHGSAESMKEWQEGEVLVDS